MRIRDGFKAIPAALQRQILRRGLMGCAFLLFSVVFLLMGYDALLVLPGVGFMLFSFASAVWLFHIADKKRYVVVEGVCAEVAKSILFKRVKTVTLEADGKILRIQLKQHRRGYRAGAKLRLYIQESAKIYERDGALLIYDYILIEQRTSYGFAQFPSYFSVNRPIRRLALFYYPKTKGDNQHDDATGNGRGHIQGIWRRSGIPLFRGWAHAQLQDRLQSV